MDGWMDGWRTQLYRSKQASEYVRSLKKQASKQTGTFASFQNPDIRTQLKYAGPEEQASKQGRPVLLEEKKKRRDPGIRAQLKYT